ncbi:hypothetical protein BH11ARM2_BH11ARM2_24890 [soil metagenome]
MKPTMIAIAVAAAAMSLAQMDMKESRYGGPVYEGAPALTVTASLVKAGGGPAHFSTAKALTSMVGPKLVKAEIAKLTKQYGRTRVGRFLQVFDFAVNDSLMMATKAGVKLPMANLSGKALAGTLVKAGMDKDGTFYTEFLLDKAVSHDIHMAVMNDIDMKFGADADKDYHRISNQAHYDLAKALKIPGVKLASLH